MVYAFVCIHTYTQVRIHTTYTQIRIHTHRICERHQGMVHPFISVYSVPQVLDVARIYRAIGVAYIECLYVNVFSPYVYRHILDLRGTCGVHTCIHTCVRTSMHMYIHAYIHTFQGSGKPWKSHTHTYICKYQELGKLGKGGFGSVFRVKQRLDDRWEISTLVYPCFTWGERPIREYTGTHTYVCTHELSFRYGVCTRWRRFAFRAHTHTHTNTHMKTHTRTYARANTHMCIHEAMVMHAGSTQQRRLAFRITTHKKTRAVVTWLSFMQGVCSEEGSPFERYERERKSAAYARS